MIDITAPFQILQLSFNSLARSKYLSSFSLFFNSVIYWKDEFYKHFSFYQIQLELVFWLEFGASFVHLIIWEYFRLSMYHLSIWTNFRRLVLFGWVLWHINHCWLFNTRSSLYIYIKYIWFGWVGFYGISTIVGHLMPNPLYTYRLNIYDLVWLGFMAYQPL